MKSLTTARRRLCGEGTKRFTRAFVCDTGRAHAFDLHQIFEPATTLPPRRPARLNPLRMHAGANVPDRISGASMTSQNFAVEPALPSDHAATEHLLDLAFGLARQTKTSYRLREGNTVIDGLSFVVRDAGLGLAGAISFWPLKIGRSGTDALLLGPLAVHPDRQNLGIGLALMRTGLDKAKALGHRLVILVGDEPYYARVGFKRVPAGLIEMPGPVDPARLLYLELVAGELELADGLVLPPHRYEEVSAAFAVPHRGEAEQQEAQAQQG
jgi:predicted N-acetyltransferase YhbS